MTCSGINSKSGATFTCHRTRASERESRIRRATRRRTPRLVLGAKRPT